MSNKVKVLLIVSLCLNVFLIGFAAREIRHFAKPQREGFAIMREFMSEHKDMLNEIDAERTNAFNMLRAEEFDNAAFAKQVDKISGLQEKMFKDFANHAALKFRAMPAEERNRILNNMEKRRNKFKKHFEKRHEQAHESEQEQEQEETEKPAQ